MKKQLVSLLMSMVVSMNMVVPAFAADPTMGLEDKVIAMEKFLYGTAQTGALKARVESLEDDVYGAVTTDGQATRIDNLYDYLQSKTDSSFSTKLNAAEWRVSGKASEGPAKTRIEKAETLLNGTAGTGALSVRLENLLSAVGGEKGTSVQAVTFPKDQVLKIEFTQELSTKKNVVGDLVHFKAADNYFLNDVLVIPKGAAGLGKITKIVQPGIFGKDGRIDIDFGTVAAMDNTPIKVTVGELSKQEAKTLAGAAGVAIGSMIVLGPVGIVGGAFVKGKSITIPAGSQTFVQTASEAQVVGVVCEVKD